MNAWLNSRKLTLDPLKTVFVFFSRKESLFPDLSIVVNLVRIAPAQTVQILDGLVLDANLKWMVHLKSKCVSTKRAILMANSCPRKSFGFDGNRLRFLYPSTVEPILSYGCSVWLLALKSKAGENTIRSFQRFAARLITRTFKTVLSESLLVLTNLLPLYLQLLKLVGARYLST